MGWYKTYILALVSERIGADLRQIQAQIAVQQERLADYVILSPMDGVVLRRDGELVQFVSTGARAWHARDVCQAL